MDNEVAAVERYKVEQAMRGTASWFTIIGGLSVLNSALASNERQFSFTVGLGVSQIGDGWMSTPSPGMHTLGFFVSFGFAGLFILFGWLARHWEPAFGIGIVLYGLDSILFLVAQDWVSLGFHLFALGVIAAGYHKYRRLRHTVVPHATPEPEAELR
jgi:MFS family permease